MHRIVVCRTLYSHAPTQLFEILNEKLGIKSVRMVVIELRALGIAHIVMRLVVVVVINNAHFSAEMLHYLTRYGGFSASGSARNAYYDYIAHPSTPL